MPIIVKCTIYRIDIKMNDIYSWDLSQLVDKSMIVGNVAAIFVNEIFVIAKAFGHIPNFFYNIGGIIHRESLHWETRIRGANHI